MVTPKKYGPKQRPRTEFPYDKDPHGLVAKAKLFLDYLKSKNYAKRTVQLRKESLAFFFYWCHDRELRRPEDINREILDRFRMWLYHYRTKRNKALSVNRQATHLTALRIFFKWLAQKNHLSYNPACELELPRIPNHLPRDTLTIEEAETIINQADTAKPIGIRDRAILELFYSTGMRRMELCSLELSDLHRGRHIIHIRKGKGGRERFVPVGERAMQWVEQYIDEVRNRLTKHPSEKALFVTEQKGTAFTGGNMTRLVKGYITAAEIGKTASCHIFRHTAATLMLENGAEIRYIQELLGHENLNTTQIYTRVSIRKLQEVHEQTHPAQRREKERKARHSNKEPPKNLLWD